MREDKSKNNTFFLLNSKRLLSVVLAIAMIVTTVGFIYPAKNAYAEERYVTIYLKDSTTESWVGNDNAVLQLVDNTNNHVKYDMTKVDNTTWSVRVNASAYNLTFNRMSEDGSTQWNSWSAGGRDFHNTYYIDGPEYGHYGYIDDQTDVFKVGDVVYLDITEYTDWASSNAQMYVNFNIVSKEDVDNENIEIASAGDNFALIDYMDEEVEEGIYKFTVTEDVAGSSYLRFWRGDETYLWNNSVFLTYDDYSKGFNCVKVTGWNDSGIISIYKESSWEDIDFTKDDDKDSVLDYIEDMLGSSTQNADTDGDGISDYDEIYVVGTDPIYVDTDKDGISDFDEDADEDGITNGQEITIYGTNPSVVDTDEDGLTDFSEVTVYKTNPNLADTDEDGVKDGDEVKYGTNPLVFNDSFDITATSGEANVKVDVDVNASQVSTLKVEKFENEFLFPNTMPGLISDAYDFEVDGDVQGNISIEFDKKLLNEESFNPVIYYFDEDSQQLIELSTKVNGNVAIAKANKAGKYILLNKTAHEDAFNWQEVWDDSNYQSVELVFVIDDSGSMLSKDRKFERLEVAKELIDNLPENSKVGVVSFQSKVTNFTTKLTSDKDVAKGYLTTDYFKSYGGTKMYTGIRQSFGLFSTSDPTVLKMAVVLTDGMASDYSYHKTTVNEAVAKDVKIYTVSLGTGLNNYIKKYLRPLAEDTNGQYYSADNASQLSNIYKDIKKKIDIETDSDGDGISDYYEENMVMFNGVKLELNKNNADTDGDGIKDGDELSEFTYQYNSDGTMMNAVVSFASNPSTQDSDYDGISDNLDSDPLSGELTGRMLGYYNANDAAYTMDYRDFFEDSTEYNNDLSTTSIVYADTVYNGCGFEYDDSSIGTITSITDLMELHGFENVENYKLSDYYSDDDLSEIGIGYHNVSYNNQDLTVVNVTVRGTNDSIEEWSSNVDIGNPVTWLSTYHKGFYTAEQRIMSYVEDYISDNESNMNDDVVYWVTGHSRGAAIANIISAELIDDNETVYGYTFAAPATTVSSTKNAAKYDSIFNIINESDVVTYVPLPQWDFGVFGEEISLDAADYNSEFCHQTGESSYNAFSSNVLNIATNRLANNCASTWAEAFDYAGSQNISDEQYASISSRALRYCNITERKSIFGRHKGYKLYPSTMFVVQLGIEMYAGSDTEKENATEMFKELWNSKFTWALVLLVGQSFFAGLPSNLDASTVAHGHAQATYYILSKQ